MQIGEFEKEIHVPEPVTVPDSVPQPIQPMEAPVSVPSAPPGHDPSVPSKDPILVPA